jgi:mxaJ protein
MSSRCLSVALVLVMAAASAAAAPLRICADPDNLPFSNRAGQGFDNRIAAVVARAAGREPEFVWARSRRGFLREQFNRGACDVLMGVPEGMKRVLMTRPYYRSTYMFVTARREHLQIASFDDPHLNGRRIGLQVLEENYAPPSLPLIRNGHAAQLVGFGSFGSGGAEIVRAVADGRVGTAVVWGPVAGYFASALKLPVVLTPVSPAVDSSGVPFSFSMGMGVHSQDAKLWDALNAALARKRAQIERILASYHVPVEEAP